MKKICSIILISTFILLQANRYTAYMSCRLKSMYTATVCDCEQILAAPENMPADHENNARFLHLQPDEYYVSMVETEIYFRLPLPVFPGEIPGEDAPGYPLCPLKPPATAPIC